jgi:hypothetical protein
MKWIEVYQLKNFAGTFIGLSEFKFNINNLTFCNITDNYNQDSLKYGL